MSAVGTTEIVFFLGQAARRRRPKALVAQSIARPISTRCCRGHPAMGRHARGRAGQDARTARWIFFVNRWLPYQTLACRVWARTGFYQASGAYGFRDQLQDVMALCVSRPDLRARTSAACRRAAIRRRRRPALVACRNPGAAFARASPTTACWLAYVVAHYVSVTGDIAVLDEMVPFLEGPVLRDEASATRSSSRRSPPEGQPVRPLRAGARQKLRDWRARLAADGHRRLERRHGPRRRRRQGRERLARLVPLCDADRIRDLAEQHRQSGARGATGASTRWP